MLRGLGGSLISEVLGLGGWKVELGDKWLCMARSCCGVYNHPYQTSKVDHNRRRHCLYYITPFILYPFPILPCTVNCSCLLSSKILYLCPSGALYLKEKQLLMTL